MELKIKILDEGKYDFFLELMQELSFVEILEKEESWDVDIPQEQVVELEKRLSDIKNGIAEFSSWEDAKRRIKTKI